MPHDAIVIGGGHNGLVAAAYLARAGLRTLVLERRETSGGAAVTEEIAPGFRCSTLAGDAAGLDAGVARDLDLAAHGLVVIEPEVRLAVPGIEGNPLVLHRDPGRTSASLTALTPDDVGRVAEFERMLACAVGVLRPALTAPPPAVEAPSFRDLWQWLGATRRFRGLGRTDAYTLLRWISMPVADLVDETFRHPLLQAAVAARGIHGVGLGPRAMGTTMTLLMRAAFEGAVAGGRTVHPIGGMGAVSQAIAGAAAAAGTEIRTGAEVARILIERDAAAGIVLRDGQEVRSRLILSGLDPKRTLLGLVDPAWLDPDARRRLTHYRCRGVVAKVNLALDALPRFTGLGAGDAEVRTLLSGRVQIGPSIDYLERASDAAKYGEWSADPFLDVTIPSLTDPALAPPDRHVLSVHVQYAPFDLRHRRWLEARDAFGDAVVAALERWAPGIGTRILARQVITPVDLEEEFGLTGGHPFHGEHALDQLFFMRPVPGMSHYRTPIAGLYLCGSGAHPGGGVTGLPGALASRQALADARRQA